MTVESTATTSHVNTLNGSGVSVAICTSSEVITPSLFKSTTFGGGCLTGCMAGFFIKLTEQLLDSISKQTNTLFNMLIID